MRIKMMLILLTFVLSTGVSASDVNKDISSDVKSAINAAKAAQKEAASLGFEWRDTGKIIKKAEAAAKNGKNQKAIELANKITQQLASVRKQAAIAKAAGPRF